ncbi:MAG: carbohydrate kinase family protein [Pirellulales bacterium]
MGIECFSAGILVADHLCSPIRKMPQAGEIVLCDELLLSIGGCASNAAMDLARVGVKVGILGCVGKDPFGRFITETLAAQGIDTSCVRVHERIGTSGTLIVNVQGEDRRFIHTVGANAALTPSDIPIQRIRQAKVFYIGGYLLMPGLENDALVELFREARAAGVTTVLDVVWPGPGEHWHKLARLLSETDVFLPNSDEAEYLTGITDPVRQAEHFLNAGARTVVITCGNEGSVLISDGLRLRAGTYPTQYVGGTGAGDAFDAGYIAGLLAGEDPAGCLRWGSALGASCVRSIGATESVFTRAEAEAFMRANSLAITSC